MKSLKMIMVVFILLMSGFSGGIYAEDTSRDAGVAEHQTTADEKPSDQKQTTEEEPECDQIDITAAWIIHAADQYELMRQEYAKSIL